MPEILGICGNVRKNGHTASVGAQTVKEFPEYIEEAKKPGEKIGREVVEKQNISITKDDR